MFAKDLYTDVNGYKTRYWDLGTGDIPILLLHGFALSCELWSLNIEEVSKSHRVIVLDLWGSGKTDGPPKNIDIELYPEFVFWFLEKLNIKKAKIVGHSMGGMLALKFALNHPEMVDSLILVGTAGFQRKIPAHFKIFTFPFVGEIMTKPNLIGLEHALYKNSFTKHDYLKVYAKILFEFQLEGNTGKYLLHMARNALDIFGFKGTLLRKVQRSAAQIKCPVLLVWGYEDKIQHFKSAFKAKKYMPHAQIEFIEQCGHLPQIEFPEKFNQILLNFIDK